MVAVGDGAPVFDAPIADGDVSTVSLDDALEDGPVVLAFFPGAFTGGCTEEMCSIRDDLAAFEAVGATVYGVSRDSPATFNEFRRQNDLNFDLVSDMTGAVVEAYEVATDIDAIGMYGVAHRSVFVIDGDGIVTYTWYSDGPGSLPDIDAVAAAAAESSD